MKCIVLDRGLFFLYVYGGLSFPVCSGGRCLSKRKKRKREREGICYGTLSPCHHQRRVQGEEEARPAGHHIVVAVMVGGAVGELRKNLHPLASRLRERGDGT